MKILMVLMSHDQLDNTGRPCREIDWNVTCLFFLFQEE